MEMLLYAILTAAEQPAQSAQTLAPYVAISKLITFLITVTTSAVGAISWLVGREKKAMMADLRAEMALPEDTKPSDFDDDAPEIASTKAELQKEIEEARRETRETAERALTLEAVSEEIRAAIEAQQFLIHTLTESHGSLSMKVTNIQAEVSKAREEYGILRVEMASVKASVEHMSAEIKSTQRDQATARKEMNDGFRELNRSILKLATKG